MVPPYGYNSRKNTTLPSYSHAFLTSMSCTRYGLSLEGASAADLVKSMQVKSEPVAQKGKVA